MSTQTDLLSRIRARLDALLDSHIKSLISASASQHDRLAGKIDALQSFKKDLSTVAQEFQVYDEEDPQPVAQPRAVNRSRVVR